MENQNLELVLSYLRVGASLDDALDAVLMPANQRDVFILENKAKIKQAQAQLRIICLHNIFSEGGQSGSKFLLEQQTEEKDSGFLF